jgi:hypothetical protein
MDLLLVDKDSKFVLNKMNNLEVINENFFKFKDEDLYYHYTKFKGNINDHTIIYIPVEVVKSGKKYSVLCRFEDKLYKWKYDVSQVVFNYGIFDGGENKCIGIFSKYFVEV